MNHYLYVIYNIIMKKTKRLFFKIIPFFMFTGTIGTIVEKSKAQPHGKSSVPP